MAQDDVVNTCTDDAGAAASPSSHIPSLLNCASFLGLPALAWLSFYIGTNARLFVLLGLLLCVVGVAFLYTYEPNPNFFLATGRTPPQTVSRELILKRRGGRGSNYWSDPSVAFGALSDFSYREGSVVDFAELLRTKGNVVGPYCVDHETRTVVFVETEEELDPAEVGPFYFQTQRDNAMKVYTVPFEEYHRVIATLDEMMASTNNLLLVYNTSRCGSTLLSKCLDNLSSVRSISEPDVLTSLTHIASEAKGECDEDIVQLARSSARLLCYLRRRRYPDCEVVCIKFRFQMVYIADLVKQALPEAKAIFLYRNALDVVDSMGAAFINTGAYRVIRYIGLDVLYVFYLSSLPRNLPKLMPLMLDTERFPRSVYMWLGGVCPFPLAWISVMHYGQDAMRRGVISTAIRYEDLIEHKTKLVDKMLQEIGMGELAWRKKHDVDDPDVNDDVFAQDVHAATTTESRRTEFSDSGERIRKQDYAYLRGDDAKNISLVLACHDEIDHSEYIVPGTLTIW